MYLQSRLLFPCDVREQFVVYVTLPNINLSL